MKNKMTHLKINIDQELDFSNKKKNIMPEILINKYTNTFSPINIKKENSDVRSKSFKGSLNFNSLGSIVSIGSTAIITDSNLTPESNSTKFSNLFKRPSSIMNKNGRTGYRNEYYSNNTATINNVEKDENISKFNSLKKQEIKKSFSEKEKENDSTGTQNPTQIYASNFQLNSYDIKYLSSRNLTKNTLNKNSNSNNKSNPLSPVNTLKIIEPMSARNINKESLSFNKPCSKPAKGIDLVNLLSSKHLPLSLSYLKQTYPNFEASRCSNKQANHIKAYAANTHQGLVRNYNEDRVAIMLNVVRPSTYTGEYWPKCYIFGIYDGHGGSGCAEYLRDYLHQFVIKDPSFPLNPIEAITKGFENAEKDFINNVATKKKGDVLDRSGSCAIVLFVIDEMCYIANVGDSRGVISKYGGQDIQALTTDHKPSDENEEKRIISAGGKVYQTQTPYKNFNFSAIDESFAHLNLYSNQTLLGPHRVLPGRLSVSRTFGDVEAKLIRLGGIPNVISAVPEITLIKITDDLDFIVLGCDGIFDQLNNKDVADCVMMTMNNEIAKQNNNLHNYCSVAVDMILKSSLARKSMDNVTCVMIAFANFEQMLTPSAASTATTSNHINQTSRCNFGLNTSYKISPTKVFSAGRNGSEVSSGSNININKNNNNYNNNLIIEPLSFEPLNTEFSERQTNSTKNSVSKNSLMMDSNIKEYLLKLNTIDNITEDSKEDKNKNSIKKFLGLKKMIYSKPENTKFTIVNNAPPNTKDFNTNNNNNNNKRNDSNISTSNNWSNTKSNTITRITNSQTYKYNEASNKTKKYNI